MCVCVRAHMSAGDWEASEKAMVGPRSITPTLSPSPPELTSHPAAWKVGFGQCSTPGTLGGSEQPLGRMADSDLSGLGGLLAEVHPVAHPGSCSFYIIFSVRKPAPVCLTP